MNNEWDRDSTWMERGFTWLLRWTGTIFLTLVLVYLGWSVYVWLRPLQ